MWSWGRLGTRPQTMSRSRLDARSEGRGSMLDLDLDLELDSEPRSRSSSMPEPAQVLDDLVFVLNYETSHPFRCPDGRTVGLIHFRFHFYTSS